MKKQYIRPIVCKTGYEMDIMIPVTSVGQKGTVPGTGGSGEPEDDWEFGGNGDPRDNPDIRERPDDYGTGGMSLW